jgi:hypothetical protein
MKGIMWPDSMPPEVLADLTAKQQPRGQQGASAPEPEQPTRPQVAAKKVTTLPSKAEEKPHPARQRGHLRVIK